MSKFATANRPTAVPSAVKTTTPTPTTLTHEGAPAYVRDAKGELFVTALTSLIREDTFYEKASTRDNRIVQLARQVTAEDPEWMQKFIPWLRTEGFMRSAPILLAAEYVAGQGPNGRAVVDSAIRRADEPAEMLGYWMQTYGRAIPQPVKRGVADAIQRLYNERNLLKYDGSSKTWRFGDVIELVHPRPSAPWQSDLFKYALDRRRHEAAVPESLEMIHARTQLQTLIPDQRRARVQASDWSEVATRAGITWEWLSGWLPGGMDAQAWEAVIPQMGYMALLRNLRNFDQAGISQKTVAEVSAKLADPVEVARSMQFPFRFYNAWNAAAGLAWAPALERALELSVQNIPEFGGRSLVIVDTSGSMTSRYSARGQMDPLTAATLFGSAVYAHNQANTDLVWATTDSGPIPWRGSVLRTIDWTRANTRPEATYLGQAVERWYDGHDRIFLFTDGQFHDRVVDHGVPVYLFTLAGYRSVPLAVGQGNAHEFGGLSDATFRIIPLLEQQKAGVWPWEV